MMDECDFRNASYIPTTVNFMMALGKSMGSIDRDSVNNFSSRNVLSISSSWSREINRQKNCEYRFGSHKIKCVSDYIDKSISSDCAEF